MEKIRLRGEEGRSYTNELASLRVRVFRDFPYLYEGNIDYERSYLETYFRAQHSFMLLLKDGAKIVGATTGILAREEEPSFQQPFVDHGFDPGKVFYFGESVLLPEYRGRGYGKAFFEEREAFARSLGTVERLAFCAVVRGEDHPLQPKAYRPLDEFWKSQGFHQVPGMITEYEWLDLGASAQTMKPMQYWMKSLENNS